MRNGWQCSAGSVLLLGLIFGCGSSSGHSADAGKSSKTPSKGTGGKSATSHMGTGGETSHGTGGSAATSASDASADAATRNTQSDSGAQATQTMDAGVDAGGVIADASSNDGSTSGPTAPGVAIAAGETKTIGAAGGSFTSADGVVTLTFPDGALSGDTLIGIHMLTNTADNALGNAYDLRSEATSFAKPIQVTFQVSSDDLAMTGTLDGVEVGYQDPQGLWHWFGNQQRDANANTVTVSTMHFTPFAKHKGKMFTVKPPPTITAAHYMINATFTFKQVQLCQIEFGDVLDGFDLTVYQDATGAVSIPTAVDNHGTKVLNEVFAMQEYPEGGSVMWTADPEVFDVTSWSATYDPSAHEIAVTLMGNGTSGQCLATINGLPNYMNLPLPGDSPVAPSTVTIAFDPSKVPISEPADADGFAYDITKF